jgi:hypothetical protein
MLLDLLSDCISRSATEVSSQDVSMARVDRPGRQPACTRRVREAHPLNACVDQRALPVGLFSIPLMILVIVAIDWTLLKLK